MQNYLVINRNEISSQEKTWRKLICKLVSGRGQRHDIVENGGK